MRSGPSCVCAGSVPLLSATPAAVRLGHRVRAGPRPA